MKMAQAEVIEILKTYLKILRSEGIQIEKAFLYGSYLTGTATDESDIDLMLVTEKANDDNSPFVDLVRRTGLEIA